MSNIYLTPNDPFLIDLREWCKNNPLIIEDYQLTKIPAWNKGVPLSDEWKKNISRAQKGIKKQGVNQRNAARIVAKKNNATIYECANCGKKANLGNYKRWHDMNCGKKIHHSEETKKKIADKLKGRPFSEEHRKNLSEGNRRRKGIKFKKKNQLIHPHPQ